MTMNYPEYNNVTSRLRCPRLAATSAFAGNDVDEPADCVFVDIGLSRRLDNKPVSEPKAATLLPKDVENAFYGLSYAFSEFWGKAVSQAHEPSR